MRSPVQVSEFTSSFYRVSDGSSSSRLICFKQNIFTVLLEVLVADLNWWELPALRISLQVRSIWYRSRSPSMTGVSSPCSWFNSRESEIDMTVRRTVFEDGMPSWLGREICSEDGLLKSPRMSARYELTSHVIKREFTRLSFLPNIFWCILAGRGNFLFYGLILLNERWRLFCWFKIIQIKPRGFIPKCNRVALADCSTTLWTRRERSKSGCFVAVDGRAILIRFTAVSLFQRQLTERRLIRNSRCKTQSISQPVEPGVSQLWSWIHDPFWAEMVRGKCTFRQIRIRNKSGFNGGVKSSQSISIRK